MSKLFAPLQIKDILLKNRIVMSPMCQYSAQDGFLNDWHYTHYLTRAIGGCGAIIQEATAIAPEGRITYADLGIWKDEQIERYAKLTAEIKKNGSIPGIQLAHAGRKASCETPWNGGKQIKYGDNSWTTIAPSSIPYRGEEDSLPKSMTIEDIDSLVVKFEEAAKRAIKAGYKIIEIHAAHGYLIHQFLSPLSNHREDQYGGSFENRIRFLIQIVDHISPLINDELSLWVRISATEWTENGWDIDESVKLAQLLKEKNIDVIDVSTGGNIGHVNIPVKPNYQVPFANEIKEKAKIRTGAVGLITEAEQAELLLSENRCDLVFLGRELLRNPYFALRAQKTLNETSLASYPLQYERGFI